jgi:phosphatidylglycerophosphatase C
MTQTPLAVFDLDGTLTDADTLLPFLVGYARRTGRRWPLARMPFDLGLYAAGLVPDRAAKGRLLQSFCGGHELAAIAEHARDFTQRWVPGRLRRWVVACLREHQRSGHRVILVSASPDLYVPVIAESLGIREVVCTQVATEGGRCLGSIDGENCKGEAKMRLLRRHLGGQGFPPGSFAYGDSPSDLPLLSAVDHGFLHLRKRGFVSVPRRS